MDIEKALEQAEEYAKCLNVKVVFAYDGFILSSRWVSNKEPLKNKWRTYIRFTI
ncbi:hypothetical protein OFR75_02285 [Brachyspira hyodysenteriae]|nr:hypothetical protein [Brachyspira hyodysenteriae]